MLIADYFQLSERQAEQFARLDALYRDWNAKINVISRKDIDNLYEHHVLHSLAIAKFVRFSAGTTVMDIGTGGGFPGIPLAILFPECRFVLVDSIGKKIKVASAIAEALGLTNVECIQERAEDEKRQFDFVVSRAVMPLPELVRLIRKNIRHDGQHNAVPNGLIVLKGGGLDAEVALFKRAAEVTPVTEYFPQEWFKGKYVVYLPV
ncbi:MAG: 16S rRNA (guanine(527)-N(7))-methyltransferase RsmG [Paludibacteraceae bacterium]|nr:16S rRNA (guanine(527)-N(7))-methyltransferase RsmG [Paludibacteraceae bacterium]